MNVCARYFMVRGLVYCCIVIAYNRKCLTSSAFDAWVNSLDFSLVWSFSLYYAGCVTVGWQEVVIDLMPFLRRAHGTEHTPFTRISSPGFHFTAESTEAMRMRCLAQGHNRLGPVRFQPSTINPETDFLPSRTKCPNKYEHWFPESCDDNQDWCNVMHNSGASVEHHGVQPTGCMDNEPGPFVAPCDKAFSGKPTNSDSTVPRTAYLEDGVIWGHQCLHLALGKCTGIFRDVTIPSWLCLACIPSIILHPCPIPTHHSYD